MEQLRHNAMGRVKKMFKSCSWILMFLLILVGPAFAADVTMDAKADKIAVRTDEMPVSTPGGNSGMEAISDLFGLLLAADIPDISDTYQPLSATLGTLANITYNANMLTFFAAANYAAMRTLLSIPQQSVCSGITAGMCLDTDDGKLYSWDGDSVELVGVLDFQPLDADLTSIAALTYTAYGGGFLELADEAALIALFSTDWSVPMGGTGASTFTNGGVLLGSGANPITAMAELADGEMIVGDGDGDPVPESGATLRTSIGVGTGDDVVVNSVTSNFVWECFSSDPGVLVGQLVCADGVLWDPSGSGLIIDHIVQHTDDDPDTWVLKWDSLGNSYDFGTELPIYPITSTPHAVTTAQAYGGWLIVTAAGDVDLPDCEAATVGMNLCIEQGDASETISVAVGEASDDMLMSGTLLGANNEVDSPGGATDRGAYICMICNEDDLWRIKGREGAWVDGGTVN